VTRVTVANPFQEHPLRRYASAWDALAERTGRHLDVGCGNGEFVGVLSATTGLDCYGADPHLDYLSVGRTEHTNYRSTELVARVEEAGFRVTGQSGPNLFWRFFQIPGLLVGGRLRALLDRMILADGRRFSSANLFLLARRIP
jgi:hypothetical protein